LRLFSFGGYGLALAALALVVFGAIECPSDKIYWLQKKNLSHITFHEGAFSIQISRTKNVIHLDFYGKPELKVVGFDNCALLDALIEVRKCFCLFKVGQCQLCWQNARWRGEDAAGPGSQLRVALGTGSNPGS